MFAIVKVVFFVQPNCSFPIFERPRELSKPTMYKTTGQKNSRIEVADALRGLAVAGIILFHSVEHFNTFSRDIKYTLPCDGTVFNVLQALLSGKMYGIFAVLFGLSFYIMRDNQEQKGKDFSLRFAWRMVLLFMFGVLNVCFYDGDILITYAILGLLLIPAGYLSNRWLGVITVLLLIQPLEIYSHMVGWHPDSKWVDMGYFKLMMGHDTFLHSAATNLRYGITVTLGWFWFHGRITQTLGLFYLGLLIGRTRLFYNEGDNLKKWRRILAVSAVIMLAGAFVEFGKWDDMLHPIWNLAILMVILSAAVLLWYRFEGFRSVFGKLGFFGRMSLTNYLLQSILGSLLFYQWGFSLYNTLGTTYSALVGLGMIVFQYSILKLWSKNHERGPLEGLWRRLTWI